MNLQKAGIFSIILYLLLVHIDDCFSQTIKCTSLEVDKNISFTKVAWVKENRFCIISDKEFNGSHFPHFIFIFDSTGAIACEPIKLKTNFSAQGEYCLVLGTSVFFLNGGENDMNADVFSITNMITEDGINHDLRKNIFNIGHSKEKKKLNTKAYSFRVYRGVNKDKALLAYNNDYINPYKEGFRFRILDKEGKLTEEDTLHLPYLDRECNIDDVIYDEATEKVYLLYDIFKFSEEDNNKRSFRKTLIGVYDIKGKSFIEITDGIPSFYECKVQHIVQDGFLAFTGLKIVEDTSAGWSAPFLLINKEPFKVTYSLSHTLRSDTIEDFFSSVRKVEKKLMLPVGFISEKDGSFIVGWTKFFTLTQMAEKESNGSMVSTSYLLFGIVGAAIAGAATSESKYKYRDWNRVLWLHYFPQKETVNEETVSSSLKAKKYYKYSYAAFPTQDGAKWLMNKPIKEGDENSSIFISKFNGDWNIRDSITYSAFSKLNINIIHPGSLYTDKGKNYFVGEYDPENKTSNLVTNDTKKIYLIEID